MTRVGVVVAMSAEARCLAAAVLPRAALRVRVGGVGAERARCAAEALAAEGAGALVSFGTAAGLVPGLAAGTLLLAEGVVSRGRLHPCDDAWRRRVLARAVGLMPQGGVVAEATEALATQEAKRALQERTGAQGADMESAAVLEVAAARRLPALVVRALADPAELALPALALEALGADGRVHLGAALGSLLRAPGQLGGVVVLAWSFARALRVLRAFAVTCGGELASPDVLAVPRPGARP